jgi:hypothetical protein
MENYIFRNGDYINIMSELLESRNTDCKIFVGNVPYQCTQDEFEKCFENVQGFVKAEIITVNKKYVKDKNVDRIMNRDGWIENAMQYRKRTPSNDINSDELIDDHYFRNDCNNNNDNDDDIENDNNDNNVDNINPICMSRGFGFVTMNNMKDAENLKKRDDIMFKGRILRFTSYQNENDKTFIENYGNFIYVEGIPIGKNREWLKKMFSFYEPIGKYFIFPEKNNGDKKITGFIEVIEDNKYKMMLQKKYHLLDDVVMETLKYKLKCVSSYMDEYLPRSHYSNNYVNNTHNSNGMHSYIVCNDSDSKNNNSNENIFKIVKPKRKNNSIIQTNNISKKSNQYFR